MISWLGGTSKQRGSRFWSQGADNGRRSLWLSPLILSCPPGNLGPAAAHYTRNAFLGQMPGVWWHINNRVTTGPGHLSVLTWHTQILPMLLGSPSLNCLWQQLSDSRFPRLRAGSVSACVCGCLRVGSLWGQAIWLIGQICISTVPVLSRFKADLSNCLTWSVWASAETLSVINSLSKLCQVNNWVNH